MAEIKNCLDTYALVEMYLGNTKFAKYMNTEFMISDLILAEFYGVILREYGPEEAEEWLGKLERYSVPVTKEILIEAVKFRQQNRGRNISFFDAVGYIFAISSGCSFVTGDKEFEKFKNVEFVKK